jgi:enoyl-CoA hydratase/carnithine racemase
VELNGMVRHKIRDGVCTVTLDAAADGNPINFALIEGLAAALDAVDADQDCRAVVLRAEGPTFCRGLDLETFFVHGSLPGRDELRRLPACLARLRRARTPVIACVTGEVTGGGVGLVAACDLVLATPDARFMLSEAIVGLVPATIVPFLLLRIGPARLRAMTLGTRGVPAVEAHGYGLVDELVDELDGPLRTQLRRVFRSAPHALAEAKRYYDSISAPDLDRQVEVGLDQFTRWLARPEVADGVRLFGEGFAPPWFARYEAWSHALGH